jgi:copper homeostasis protein
MLEVCVETIQAAKIAAEAGADRVELCSVLEVGGVTPSGPLVSAVRRAIELPLIVLIRSRAGGFVYREEECKLMVHEAKMAIGLGADGVAIGGLTPSLGLDLTFLRSIANALPKSQLVMHRAFDSVHNREGALECLVELGFTRILTSGGGQLAIDNTSELCRLLKQAQGRIEILPAGGISPSNALTILNESGANQLHGSFRIATSDAMKLALPNADAIQQTKAILNNFTLSERCRPFPSV